MVDSDRSKANWEKALHAMPEIEAKLGTESNCELIALSACAKRTTIYCPRRECGFLNTIPNNGKRVFPCRGCSKNISITAETYFHKVQKFKPRLIMMELYERGIVLSANQLAKLTGVSTDTASRTLKRLALMAISEMINLGIEIASALCADAVCRRTTKTPAGEPPIAEEALLQLEANRKKNESPSLEMLDISEEEKLVLQEISESGISFDQLAQKLALSIGVLSATLTVLELKGLIEKQFADSYKLSKKMQSSMTMQEGDSANEHNAKLAKNFVTFVKDFFQGLGRKYLQLYSTLDWIAKDRSRWPSNSLIEFCASNRCVSEEEIEEYVTPLAFYVVPDTATT